MTTYDSHLANLDSHEAKAQPGGIPEIEEPATDAYVVSVRNETPALGTAYCVTLNANNEYLELVPRDPNRRNAVVLAVDNDVYICSSREVAAQAAAGTTSTLAFYLSKGIAVPIDSKAPYWVACTTTSGNSRVSVMVNKDDE
jgi:hypothetical protein